VAISNAHRGDPIAFRENTIPAFTAAVAQGAGMVEFDVKRTRDEKAVVLHDDSLERLWAVPRLLRDLTYQEVLELCSSQEYSIPLLEDVFRQITTPIMVDFVHTDAVVPIVDVLKRLGCVERALLTTGNTEALRRIRAELPNARIGLTWNDVFLPSFQLITELNIEYFNPCSHLLDPEFINTFSEALAIGTTPPELSLNDVRTVLLRRQIHPEEFSKELV
jgi:glycerophosphoryl diester phosphodiesterase